MTVRQSIERVLGHSPLVAGSLYGVALAGLIAVTALALADLYAGRRALADTADLLERMQTHKTDAPGGPPGVTGSPFLEGPTVTVAGATLLQRVTNAVTKAGGTIQSTQVDVAGAEGGAVKLQVSCEIDQFGLQRLLYDLEAGMPFLFVDQLNVQMPQAVAAAETAGTMSGVGKMHVQFGVSGQWQGARK